MPMKTSYKHIEEQNVRKKPAEQREEGRSEHLEDKDYLPIPQYPGCLKTEKTISRWRRRNCRGNKSLKRTCLNSSLILRVSSWRKFSFKKSFLCQGWG